MISFFLNFYDTVLQDDDDVYGNYNENQSSKSTKENLFSENSDDTSSENFNENFNEDFNEESDEN